MATVYVTVDPVEDSPVARTDIVVVGEGGSISVNVIGNDSDAEGPVTVDWVDGTSWLGGEVDYVNGEATYDNWMEDSGGSGGSGGGGHSVGTGWDFFSYGISDTAQNTATGRVDIYVNPGDPQINAPPFSRPDQATTMEDTTLQNIAVLGNDWDDADILTITNVFSVTPGAIVTHDGSTVTYTPPPNFHGTDTVYYDIEDDVGQPGSYASGGMIEIEVESINDEPQVVVDQAWTGWDETITISVLNGATDEDGDQLIVTDASGATKGYVCFDGEKVTYNPFDTFTQGTDTFTYVVKDGHGGVTDPKTVTVTMVEVTDWQVEWQDSDGNWNLNPPGEAVWSHETLRWKAFHSPTPPNGPQGIYWIAQDWTDFESGVEHDSIPYFTSAPGDESAIGNPGVGIWAILPHINFGGFLNQTAFVATMTTAAVQARGDQPDVKIESIKWVEGSDSDFGDVYNEPNGDVSFYPDAISPGDPIRNRLYVEVTITPQVENVHIWLEWYDVDDPSDRDGPIDSDPDITVNSRNDSDNILTGEGPEVPLVFGENKTDQFGKVQRSFHVTPQPGNNYRVAAMPRLPLLAPVSAIADDLSSRLWYDIDRNGIYDASPSEPLMDENSSYRGIHVTPRLTVWRMLYIEVDSMGVVVGNKVSNTITNVTYNLNSTSTVTLANALDQDDVAQNRFQGGNLQDSSGNQFGIISHTATTITINTPIGPGLPTPQQGTTIIRDDDEWQDGEDIPMPDTSEVANAFREAFVVVRFLGGTLNPNTTVPFRQHLDAVADLADVVPKDTAGQNSASFWTAYLVAAFQGAKDRDNDSNSHMPSSGKNPLYGQANRNLGIAVVYMETNRDLAVEYGDDIAEEEQDTVVHELGHIVGDSGDEPVSIDSRYTEVYLKHIRSVQKPAG